MGNVPNLRFAGFEGEWKTLTLGECSKSLDYGMNVAAMEYDGENKLKQLMPIGALPCPVRDKMLVENKIHNTLPPVPYETECGFPIGKGDACIFYQHIVPDGTKINIPVINCN
jgi:hypothetical protein